MRDGKSFKVVLGEEKEKITHMNADQLLDYFKAYYLKWTVLLGIILFALISMLVNFILSRRDLVLGGMTVNIEADDEAYTFLDDGWFAYKDYSKYHDRTYVTTKQYIDVNDDDYGTFSGTIYRPESSLIAQISAGDLDFLICDKTVLNTVNAYDAYADLRDILSDEQIERYADRFLYMENSDGETKPVAVSLTDSAFSERFGAYTVNSDIYIGFIANGPNLDDMPEYLDYIFDNCTDYVGETD